jgi:hypothetical protein
MELLVRPTTAGIVGSPMTQDGVIIQTPETFLDGAAHYAAAADAVNDRHPDYWHVVNHLLGMSIELALKAYLLHHGYNEKQLRALGHKLKALFDEAVKLGLTETGSRSFRLVVHGANYARRLFAYPGFGNLHIIKPWSVREAADGIIAEVYVALRGEAAYEAVRSQPGLCVRSSYSRD